MGLFIEGTSRSREVTYTILHTQAEARHGHRTTAATVLIGFVALLVISSVASRNSPAPPSVFADGAARIVSVLPTEAACWQAVRRSGHQFGVTAGCRFIAGAGWVFEIW